MLFKISKLLMHRGYRYLIVGGSVYVFELAVIVVAQQLGADPTRAVAISFILGTLLSFAFQKFFTFGDQRLHHKIVIAQLMATIILVLVNFGFTIVVTKLLSDLLPAVICRTLALGITTCWNFYLYKTRIFKTAASPVF